MPQLPDTNTPAPRSASVLPALLAASALGGLGLGLALIAWSRNYVNHNVPLMAALDGELVRFRGRRAGELAHYVAGPARRNVPPLVLIHSINAAASSYEMKPLYDHYARTRRVIALDLPGYGFSDRSDRAYLPALMRDAILDLVEQQCDGQAVDVAALSLSAEFLAQAALVKPLLFRTLTFLTPTGLGMRNQTIRPNDAVLELLRVDVWRRPIYDLLTSRPSLSYFTQTNQRRKASREFINYAYATSHQPDAEYAPLHFLAFKLFTPTIFRTYASLVQPCALIYGQDPFAMFDLADELIGRPNWRALALENAGALVHWDNPTVVIAQMDQVIAKT
jgi:pimeloyl-ACP methyl ester carboxylesterase